MQNKDYFLKILFDEINKRKKKFFRISNKKIEDKIALSSDFHQFINRYRNCNLNYYHDDFISNFFKNKKELTKPNFFSKDLRISIVLENPNDTGSASVIKRYILSDCTYEGFKIKNYILILVNNKKNFLDSGNYFFLKNKLKVSNIKILETKDLSNSEKSKKITQYLKLNKIHCLFSNASPIIMNSIKKKPVLLSSFLTQDCHVWNIGYNHGDINFYVISDQFVKYKDYDDKPDYKKILLELPVPDDNELKSAKRVNFNFAKNKRHKLIISASTNMWKCFFGDNTDFLQIIGKFVRKNKNYHHVFVGTARSLETAEMYIKSNPDLKKNIHFFGISKNIYSILKSVDFFINSFPVSGGSSIEAALVGTPTIDLLYDKDHTLHSMFLYKNNELTATNKFEFEEIMNKLIKKQYDTNKLKVFRNFLKLNYNKERIVKDKIYKTFINLLTKKKIDSFNFKHTIDYELKISLFDTIIKLKPNINFATNYLSNLIRDYKNRPFAYIRYLQLLTLKNKKDKFISFVKKIPLNMYNDIRLILSLHSGIILFNLDKNKKIKPPKLNFVFLNEKYEDFFLAIENKDRKKITFFLKKLYFENYY